MSAAYPAYPAHPTPRLHTPPSYPATWVSYVRGQGTCLVLVGASGVVEEEGLEWHSSHGYWTDGHAVHWLEKSEEAEAPIQGPAHLFPYLTDEELSACLRTTYHTNLVHRLQGAAALSALATMRGSGDPGILRDFNPVLPRRP
jgi:hypothetical protein